MIYLAWFILFFTVVQFLVAASNWLFLQTFPTLKNNPNVLVSVLIPARNEEKNIGNILTDLQKQDYQNIEIIVFNDQSHDRTSEIVNDLAKSDKRIKLINSNGLPNGWLGKNNACHSLAQNASGKYFLFLDADVRIGNSIIQNTLNFSKNYRLGLFTIFPKQEMKTVGEQLTVPIMNFILLSLLPLVLVRKTSFPSVAAANGQFMLFEAENYRKLTPHEQLKNSKVEDIEIARFYKKNKIKVACLVGDSSISCRMYNSFSESVHGFSKNIIQFFGGSFLTAILFWLITTFGFLAVWISFSPTVFILYLLILVLIHAIISVVSKQSVLKNVALIIPHQITMGIFIGSAILNTFKKQYTWKGRNISS